MVATAFALIDWIPQLAQIASEPVTLVLWGGTLIAVGSLLRSRAARRPAASQDQSDLVRSSVAQPVEG